MINNLFFDKLKLIFSSATTRVSMLILNGFIYSVVSVHDYGFFALARTYINLVETTLSAGLNPIVLAFSVASSRRLIYLSLFKLTVYLIIPILCVYYFYLSTVSVIEGVDFYIIFSIFLLLISGLMHSVYFSKLESKGLFIPSAISLCAFVIYSFVLVNNFKVIGAFISLFIFYIFETSYRILIFNRSTLKLSNTDGYNINYLSMGYSIAAASLNAYAFFFLRIGISNSSGGLSELAVFDMSFQIYSVCVFVLSNLYLFDFKKNISLYANSGLLSIFPSRYFFVATIVFSIFSSLVLFFVGTFLSGFNFFPVIILILSLPLYLLALHLNRSNQIIGGMWRLIASTFFATFSVVIISKLFFDFVGAIFVSFCIMLLYLIISISQYFFMRSFFLKKNIV